MVRMSAVPEPQSSAGQLSQREREILETERYWWKYSGAKDQAIKEKFAMSAARYYQILNQLIDTEAALAYDPLLVKRLRRMRDARARLRAARRSDSHL